MSASTPSGQYVSDRNLGIEIALTSLASIAPNCLPGDFHQKSRAQLARLFQHRFEQREQLRKGGTSAPHILSLLIRNLRKEDRDTIEREAQTTRQRALGLAKLPLSKALLSGIRPHDVVSWTDLTFGPPFLLPAFIWKTHSGDAGALYSDDANADAHSGQMDFSIMATDGAVACTVALGIVFQPTAAAGLMNISSNPSITYSYGNAAFLSHAQTHAFLGFYVGQYTLGGDFTGAVIDQEINLWDMETDHDISGSSAGFPLVATVPVDSNHFYEIWVWAGGHVQSSSFSKGQLAVTVPSISLHMY